MTSQLPLFSVFFSAASSKKNHTKSGAAVTSLRSFLFHDDFSNLLLVRPSLYKSSVKDCLGHRTVGDLS